MTENTLYNDKKIKRLMSLRFDKMIVKLKSRVRATRYKDSQSATAKSVLH